MSGRKKAESLVVLRRKQREAAFDAMLAACRLAYDAIGWPIDTERAQTALPLVREAIQMGEAVKKGQAYKLR